MDYMKKFSIPMSQPDITDEEREAVASVLRTNYLSMGPYVLEFERLFQEFTGCRHAIAVNSGTAGLHLCVRSAGWKDGDWVITTPFSFVSSTNALLFERITPVFVDVDPTTGNINPELVAAAVRDLTESRELAKQWLPEKGFSTDGALKGILAVDTFGQPAAYEQINTSAKAYQLKVIEDSCEALGAMYKNRPAGRLADYGVFAFYPNKQITTGEGGIVITDCDEDAELIRALRNQGRAPGDTWLDHSFLGYNYRMDEMSAALGVAQMRRIDQLIQAREQVAAWYKEELSSIDGVECPNSEPTTTRDSWFVYVIRLKPGLDRSAISQRMTAMGVPVRPYFSPIHLQPYMREKFGYVPGKYPVAEDLGRRGLAIPFSGKMTREQVQEVASIIQQSL
ncbi:DegT/DnrJ/EryC1/StrS family aminotransferase [Flexilinea flocculi]|jgi:dTDP-4-amino-4,6-dideoxygalactose transaminase|uniref:dTDP-4-amino-4,6-dideoxygalactose transaminase n=1 Tax=Flexilinea flocculi TaxID=1678840 RepID=A0A0K8P9N4_9CHLR|nr:DegT/DnrJ/EryC1/StrS family aminotransferase [Flexilinea flocculi]GAP39372.1 dTDP-4-amino-4,6-dideoxygalactose transaminase [Flexilinea flocculi]